MTAGLFIEADWETLERGTDRERACFSALGIRYGHIWLSEAQDNFVNRIRRKPHLSAYRFAEWLAWNWWRLRWEPYTRMLDWALAHRMATIGGGFIWPNITIFSDGERVALLAKPTQPVPQEPLRYITDLVAVVRAGEFEDSIDCFIDLVIGKLRAENIDNTNLEQIWNSVRTERADPAASKRRRFEAMLGCDPDEADEVTIERLVADSELLGEKAMNEIAAHRTKTGGVLSAEQLRQAAATNGYDAMPGDAVKKLDAKASLPPVGQVPAWKRGAEAAQALRSQERLGTEPIPNKTLAAMMGVTPDIISERSASPELSLDFELSDGGERSGRIVLRSKWQDGRRFGLSRLLGDRLIGDGDGRLFPATQSYTYRQKMQRAFAAEFLCPFDAVEDMLHGDYSSESIEDIAKHFVVSELTVRTLLVNHGRIDREDLLEGNFESAVAA
ncbi:MAG: hypothetical protein U1F76_04925 [Candidatus Competibacteraceae bacterium]